MRKDEPEQSLDVDKLLAKITIAVVSASAALDAEFTSGVGKSLPYILRIPRTTCTIKLSFSYSGSTVKGIFHQVRTSEEQQIVSTVELEFVAAPRAAP